MIPVATLHAPSKKFATSNQYFIISAQTLQQDCEKITTMKKILQKRQLLLQGGTRRNINGHYTGHSRLDADEGGLHGVKR
mmetsp:Transcript_75166/g.151110  ORF Transcript_75166/g.151110 Transcript_75166/m.151110 type:complete len:80 (-) Transcript_75166:246-485(-)